MSVSDEAVSFSLEVNVEEAFIEMRKLNTVIYRTLGLLSKMGGSDFKQSIAQVQRLIALLNQARLAVTALHAAMYLGAGPLGWALAGVAIGGVVIGGVEYTESMIDSQRGT